MIFRERTSKIQGLFSQWGFGKFFSRQEREGSFLDLRASICDRLQKYGNENGEMFDCVDETYHRNDLIGQNINAVFVYIPICIICQSYIWYQT